MTGPIEPCPQANRATPAYEVSGMIRRKRRGDLSVKTVEP
jgi:hypothetical protein